MITISENKISSSESLKPNDNTIDLDKRTNTIRFLELKPMSTASNNDIYTITDEFVYEVKFNITITKWNNIGVPSESVKKTISWANLQNDVALYSNGNYVLTAKCNLSGKTLTITYSITCIMGKVMSNVDFEFSSTPAIRGAIIGTDLVFQNGDMEILSPVINYKKSRYLHPNEVYTFTDNCIAMKKARTASTNAWSAWRIDGINIYEIGDRIVTGESEEIKVFIYLIFKNPED